jgi:hypothetical protein
MYNVASTLYDQKMNCPMSIGIRKEISTNSTKKAVNIIVILSCKKGFEFSNHCTSFNHGNSILL